MALREDDHYILKKLHNEVLPWMIGGRRARRRWFVWLAQFYAYGGEIATALTGLGVGAPLIALFQGKVDGDRNAIAVLAEVLPGYWFWIGGVALFAWIAARIVVARQDAITRAVLARECDRAMQRLYTRLYVALASPVPMARIGEIQKDVMVEVEKAIDKQVWPWNPPMPHMERIRRDLDTQLDDIRSKFMNQWDPPPPGGTK